MPRNAGRYAGVVATVIVMTVAASLAWAATYTWSDPEAVGDPDQFGTWSNGVNQVGMSVDKTVDPTVTYTHYVYVSDYSATGVFASDAKCSGRQNVCMAAWYVRSTNGGRTWQNAVQLPAPADHMPYERPTLAVTGKTLIATYLDQTSYYQGGSTLDVDDPRFLWVTRSTNHGSSWTNARKLPGQTNNSRGDYLNSVAAGTNVYVTTTNVQTGAIWLWRSTDRGKTWEDPVSLGTTSATDEVTGYVGGFSGLPSVGARGDHVVVAWTNTAAGQIVARVSDDGGDTFAAETQLEATGGNANNGYVQMDSRDSRIAVSWTTPTAAKLKVFDTGAGTFGATRTITTFPEPDIDDTIDDGGEGAVVALGPGGLIGVSLSVCNTISDGGDDFVCNEPDLLNNDTREGLYWYSSEDGGVSWTEAFALAEPKTPAISWESNYGDAIYVKRKPLVLWNSHDAEYNVYEIRRSIGTPV
jgi:hypothetical protein